MKWRKVPSLAGSSALLITERIVRLAATFSVGVAVARVLGPTLLGRLSYASAWVGLFAVIAPLGVDVIAPREFANAVDRGTSLVWQIALLRVVGLAFATVLTLATLSVLPVDSRPDPLLVALLLLAQWTLTGDILILWMESRERWGLVVVARQVSLWVAVVIRGILLMNNAPLWMYAAAAVAETLILSIAAFALSGYQFKNRRFGDLSRLARTGLPALLSSVAIVVYMRIDQIMVATMLSTTAAGLYAVAVRVSEIWYILPSTVIHVAMPGLMRMVGEDRSGFLQRLSRVTAYLFYASLAAAFLATLFAPTVMEIVFGEAYRESGQIVRVYFWAGLFVSLGWAARPWMVAHQSMHLATVRTVVGAVLNIGLNMILIPRAGLTGAAVATVAAQGFVGYISLWVVPGLQPVRRYIHRGLLGRW